MASAKKGIRRKTMIKTLSTEERVAIARDYLARVFNGGNAERAREFFTPDVVWHGGALGTDTGVDTIIPVLGGPYSPPSRAKALVPCPVFFYSWALLRLLAHA